MKRLKWLLSILLLGVLSLLLPSILLVKNTNAIVPLTRRNVEALIYNLNSTSSNPIQATSINSYSMSPIITLTTNANQTNTILRPKFVLNNTVKLSTKKFFRLKLKISIGTSTVYTSKFPNVSFICPQGDYNEKINVVECKIEAYNKSVQSYETSYTTSGEIFDISSDYTLEDFYVTIDVNTTEEEERSYQIIPFLGRIISIYNDDPNGSVINTIQFTYMLATSYQTDWTASDEMNEKDNQDRNNINNQQDSIDSDADDSTENMDNATSNITGIVSTFLGNLNNLNRNNCTLPEISAYGFSLGQLNLCTFQPPQWVRTVTSAVVSLIVLSMAVHVFKRIMRIAKGIAGSK